ncbi:MAG: hypothetical protein HOQ05_01490 [Corynebacteriales bacterium]|nr:hypothetical protein [Mycobacteriales bacterium]
MGVMDIFTKRPKLRWFVPVVFASAALAIPLASGAIFADDDTPALPKKTAQELLTDMRDSEVDGFSGTLVKNADLGLPSLGGDADFAALSGGTHTLRVWSAGSDKTRVALLGELGESDWIHNGKDAWFWSSEDNSVIHEKLDASEQPAPPNASHTPDQAADEVLGLLGPNTDVATDGTTRVASRDAYELVVKPRTDTSLIGEVRIAIDAEKSVPLSVQMFTKTGTKPAFEVGFTHIDFQKPGDEHFRFTPPPGAKVSEGYDNAGDKAWEDMINEGTFVGENWEAVWVGNGANLDEEAQRMIRALPAANGEWGRGHILESKLFSVLITDDGQIYVGAVTPERLYEAANSK